MHFQAELGQDNLIDSEINQNDDKPTAPLPTQEFEIRVLTVGGRPKLNLQELAEKKHYVSLRFKYQSGDRIRKLRRNLYTILPPLDYGDINGIWGRREYYDAVDQDRLAQRCITTGPP